MSISVFNLCYSTISVKSFRHTNVNLQSFIQQTQKPSFVSSLFGKKDVKLVKTFKINHPCRSMCYVNSKIYFPCAEFNSLLIYSVEGYLIKDIRLYPFNRIQYPRALHPLREGRLVVAAMNGLYEIDYEGTVMCQVMEGDFRDVHVSGHLMAAIEHDSENSDESDKRVYIKEFGRLDRSNRICILSTTAPYPQSAGFSLGHTWARTVLLSEDASTVCVSDWTGQHITTYSLSGQRMSQAGGEGQLFYPQICAKDSRGQVLICDTDNNRLQLLSAGGEWAVLLRVQLRQPTDVFIQQNNLYVLHGFNVISVFKST